jgi:apolipoprotein D and lipocalin family protein
VKTLTLLLIAAGAFGLVSCARNPAPLQVATNFDANKYQGEWHEIARLPNFFEKELVAAKATYRLQTDGSLSVHNQGLRANGDTTEIKGAATPVAPARLKVRFEPFPASLFAGDYWVLSVNDAHTHALVGAPNRKFFWLLSKDPGASVKDFTTSLRQAKTNGFAIERLIQNPQRIP